MSAATGPAHPPAFEPATDHDFDVLLHGSGTKWVSKGRTRGRRHQNLTIEQERQLLEEFHARAERAGMLEVSQIQRAYEEAAGHAVPKSTVCRMLGRHARMIAAWCVGEIETLSFLTTR